MTDNNRSPRAPSPVRGRGSANRNASYSTPAARQHFEQHLSEMLRDGRITQAPPPATRRLTGSRPPPSPAQRQLRRTSRETTSAATRTDTTSSPNWQTVDSPQPPPASSSNRLSRMPESDYNPQSSPRPGTRYLATDSNGHAYLASSPPDQAPTDQTSDSPAIRSDLSTLPASTLASITNLPLPVLRPTSHAMSGLDSQQQGQPFTWTTRNGEMRQAGYVSGAKYAIVAEEQLRREREEHGRVVDERARARERARERARAVEQTMPSKLTPTITALIERTGGSGRGAGASGGAAARSTGGERRESAGYWDTVLGRDS